MTVQTDLEQVITSQVLKRYIDSSDFNGVSVSIFAENLGLDETRLRHVLFELLSKKKIALRFQDSGNPHIKRLPDQTVQTQIEKLKVDGIDGACAYPSCEVLAAHFDHNDYADRPYTRALYLGAAQLEPRFFEMSVLERYQNDPRYHFNFDYFSGTMSVRSDYHESNNVPERDQVFLQTFGLGISKKKDRCIAVFLRYLHNLTPEHQQYWRSYEIEDEEHVLVPEYHRPAISGEFPTHEPIYIGVLEEIRIINEMCSRIGKPAIFRKTFEEKKPLEFGLFLRPTQRDFDAFVHTADKILSENLNHDFFASWQELDLETVTENKDGTQTRVRKSTVRLLDDWLHNVIVGADEDEIKKIIEPIREVRKLRQAPAHKINPNVYDVSFFDQQRDIMRKIYVAVRLIRLQFTNHPTCSDVEVPAWLQEGRLRNY